MIRSIIYNIKFSLTHMIYYISKYIKNIRTLRIKKIKYTLRIFPQSFEYVKSELFKWSVCESVNHTKYLLIKI